MDLVGPVVVRVVMLRKGLQRGVEPPGPLGHVRGVLISCGSAVSYLQRGEGNR